MATPKKALGVTCAADDECDTDLACGGLATAKTCGRKVGADCTAGTECASTFCFGGATKSCSLGALSQSCDTDANCTDNTKCVANKCLRIDAGKCDAAADCASGACVEATGVKTCAPTTVGVDLAGERRCQFVTGLVSDSSTKHVIPSIAAAECTRLGGTYAAGACTLVACTAPAAPVPCNQAGDKHYPTLATSTTPLSNVCVRGPANLRRIHVTRPDLFGACVADDAEDEGEVLIGMTADECTKFGASDNYTAAQCRLRSYYTKSKDDGKCGEFLGAASVERTGGTIGGLSEKTCLENGGTWEAPLCKNVTYCAVEGADDTHCEADALARAAKDLGWGTDGAPVAVLFVSIGVVILIIVVVILWRYFTKGSSGGGGVTWLFDNGAAQREAAARAETARVRGGAAKILEGTAQVYGGGG